MGVAAAGGLASLAGGLLGSMLSGNKGPTAFDDIAEQQHRASVAAEKYMYDANTNAAAGIESRYQEAVSRSNPYIQQGQDALSFYNGLLGIGEQAGTAMNTYKNSAYAQVIQEQLDLAKQQITRQAAGSGMLASGNFATALADTTRRQTEQGLGTYLGALKGTIDTGSGMVQGLNSLGLGAAQVQGNYNIAAAQAKAEGALFRAQSHTDRVLGNAQLKGSFY